MASVAAYLAFHPRVAAQCWPSPRSFAVSSVCIHWLRLRCAGAQLSFRLSHESRGQTRAGDKREPAPAVIGPKQGEHRFLRGGTASLLIKMDPVITGSRHMVLGSSDLPPGDSISLHRHLNEDEIS